MEGSSTGDQIDETKEQFRDHSEAAKENVQASADRAQSGKTVEVAGDEYAVRPIVAIGIFVAVFTVLYLLTWTVLGGIGLAVGIFIAGPLAALAAKLYVDRAGSA